MADEGPVDVSSVRQLLLAQTQLLAASSDMVREDAPKLGGTCRGHAGNWPAKPSGLYTIYLASSELSEQLGID